MYIQITNNTIFTVLSILTSSLVNLFFIAQFYNARKKTMFSFLKH